MACQGLHCSSSMSARLGMRDQDQLRKLATRQIPPWLLHMTVLVPENLRLQRNLRRISPSSLGFCYQESVDHLSALRQGVGLKPLREAQQNRLESAVGASGLSPSRLSQ